MKPAEDAPDALRRSSKVAGLTSYSLFGETAKRFFAAAETSGAGETLLDMRFCCLSSNVLNAILRIP